VDTLKSLVQARFPRAELDDASAAVFILDCLRLDLDPLLGEIVPVTFRDKRSGRRVVAPVLTEDGWLALAARACPDMWLGPPSTEPVTDEAFKEALLGEDGRDAYVWKAVGRVRRGGESVETVAYGWLKRREWQQARQQGTPAGELPGNQARVRAVKRWVRESFPEARARMKEMTGLWLARAEEVREARRVIHAQYRLAGPSPENGSGEEPAASEAALAPGAEGITERQRRALFAMAGSMGWDSARLHRWVAQRFHREHISQLSREEAVEAIDALRREGALA
jgi:hypothetical protein